MTTFNPELTAAQLAAYPYRKLNYVQPELAVQAHADGSYTLSCPIALKPPPRSIPHLFKQKAKAYPERVWLAEKDQHGRWTECSYRHFDRHSDSVAQWLLDQGYGEASPMLVLSENSVAHALIIMGAMKARVPVTSVSAAYSLLDESLTKLKVVVDLLRPQLIFAECAQRYGRALAELADPERVQITAANAHEPILELGALLETQVTTVSESIDGITHDTVAKNMFTSGSTGTPKCVVHTQGILCAQVAAIDSISVNEDPANYSPVSLQWMPWSHVSAGNISYHEAMLKGGAIYIDDGKPVPGLFDKTIQNLRSISTSVFGSAPLGLSWLATALEEDPALQAAFFKELEAIAYGGSALPEDVALRIQRLAVANTGKRIPIVSMYGSTETQGITATYWATEVAGVIGLPTPGTQVRLVPTAGKLEVRVKGGTVMREYLGEPGLTQAAFDDRGYFKMGDAARFADPLDPSQGLVFDGRISEDFKLLSGTWVSTAAIKAKLLACMGRLVRDMVICGENQLYVSALAWLDLRAARELAPGAEGDAADLTINPAVRTALQAGLDQYNAENPGSSSRVKSVVLLLREASLATGEINEKGYVNTKLVAQNRRLVLDKVYRHDEGLGVISEASLTHE